LFQAQKLAIIHAVGLNVDTRSHFEADGNAGLQKYGHGLGRPSPGQPG
jgi:hypothetical protein